MNAPTEDPLDRWLADWLHGTISPADLRALEARLLADPAARAALRRAANLDSALRDWAARDSHAAAWLAPEPVAPAAPARFSRGWRLALGLAAVVVLGFSAFFFGRRSSDGRVPAAAVAAEQTDRGAAIFTQAVDATWAGPAARLGDSLGSGRRVLQSGLVQLEFFSGATLVIEGPAEFEIVSPWRVAWTRGKARVRVPPAARGFELITPEMKLVDLGTEFGVEVGGAGARVQVFSGEVEAHPKSGGLVKLTEGQALRQIGAAASRTASVQPEDFPTSERLHALGRTRAESRFARWEAFGREQRRDPRLLALYDFQRDATADRLVRNVGTAGGDLRDGGAVGATWSAGRWPQKNALEFKRPGDRVRLDLPGTYGALTLAGWVKVDGLDRKYNSLLLTDGYEHGEPHWQIFEDGRLMFSLMYPDAARPGKNRNRIYFSPVIFDRANTGRWHHVAVTYENRTGAVVHFVDGVEVSREIDELHEPGRPVVYGACELGNWGLPTIGQVLHPFPIRNFNGCIDEFAIYSAALSGAEIRAMFEAGRPE